MVQAYCYGWFLIDRNQQNRWPILVASLMLTWMDRSRTNGGQTKAEKIAAMVQKIAESDQSVEEYFRTHRVPFNRRQYFRYKARLAAEGISGLDDGRSQGNYRKLTSGAESFLREMHQQKPELSLQELCESLKRATGIEVGRSTVSGFFKRVGAAMVWPRPREPKRVRTAAGGFEIVAALALHLGWVEHTGGMVERVVAGFRRTAVYRQQRVSKDRKGRQRGRFTADYNQRPEVRERRFASVEEKRENKNYSRMGLFQASRFIVERKCLGILALPLTTLNGSTRSANEALGNALEHFCGYNYQHHSLDKFLRGAEVPGVGRRTAARSGGVLAEALAEAGRKVRTSFPVLLRGRQYQAAVVTKTGEEE